MGKVYAVCSSPAKGTQKTNISEGYLKKDWGLEGDAHAGKWHRQVSLLSLGKIEEFNARGGNVDFGAFGENIVADGYDFRQIPVGTRFLIGEAIVEITQIGKECHSHCEVYKRVGDCIMPREGVFARVVKGGKVKVGDEIKIQVYADNAATTRPSKACIDAMLPCLQDDFGNASSLYSIGQEAKEIMEEARETMAKYLNAEPREIYFTSGGSEADNQALISAARAGARKGKKHIISTAFEHHAILHTLNKLEKEGFEVTLLDVHPNGVITVEDVANAIREDTCLVTIMFVNNEIGTIQPIKEIGALCREKKILFHTDAVQAAGHLPIDVKEMNIDMLSLSAHKFHGPKGTGILYAKRGIPLVNVIEGGAQERGKRAGTENIAGIAGMAAAFAESCDHMAENEAKIIPMRDKLIEELTKIPHSRLNGDPVCRNAGTVNFCFEGIEGESLLLLLDDAGISASSGSACTSGSLDPSHVLLAIGLPHEVAHGSLRLSIGEYNSMAEIDQIVEAVPKIVDYLRSISPFWADIQAGKMPHWI